MTDDELAEGVVPVKLKRVGPGYYETREGHRIERHGEGRNVFWAITWPGETLPDVSRPTLREAYEYVQTHRES